jgi:hypothetical protein
VVLPAIVVMVLAACAEIAGIGDFSDSTTGGQAGVGGQGATGAVGAAGGGGEPFDTVCVPAPPSDWEGPVALRLSTDRSPLACDTGWPISKGPDGVGPPGGLPECNECSCGAAANGACPDGAPITRGTDTGCALPIDTYSSTVVCTTLAQTVAGRFKASDAPPVPGSCPPEGGGVIRMPDPYPQYATTCEVDAAPACGDGGVAIPELQAPADWAICIYQIGDVPQCPPGTPYDADPIVVTDFDDNRTCAECECGTPQGVTCGGYNTFYFTAADCASAFNNLPHDDECYNISSFRSFMLQSLPAVTNEGSCTPMGGGPAGQIDVIEQRTLCCLER